MMYAGVKLEDVDLIIEDHLEGGRPVERLLQPLRDSGLIRIARQHDGV